MRRPIPAALLSFAALATAGGAAAQTDPAVAEKLFREGKSLFDRKLYAEACPKLAESQRLDPASGTLLALAVCHEAEGKLASAWGEYTNAVSLSRKDGNPKREKAAAARAAALEPKLDYATFELSTHAADTPGLELRKDGVLLRAASWHDFPIDRGTHTVEVSAPKKKTYSASFVVQDHTTVVRIPELEDLPVVVVPPPPPPAAPFPMRTVGIVGGSIGVGAAVIGGVLGAIAIAKAHDANSQCTPTLCTDPAVVSENGTAKTLADASTTLVVVGLAVVAGGAALVFFAPRRPAPAAGLVVGPGPGDAGASVGWRF